MASSREAASGDEAAALARRIDHTLLAPVATGAEVDRLCDEARAYGFAAVCVAGPHVCRAARRVARGDVRVAAVVGFPSGAVVTAVKALEAELAVRDGADEIDVVADLGAIREGRFDAVQEDLRAVVAAARGRPVKAILETARFEAPAIRAACAAAERAGCAWVKTSTGFGPGGATVDAVRLLRASVGPGVRVKASGGIRDRATALAMIAAGADRLGASAGVVIVRGGPGASPGVEPTGEEAS